MNEREREVLPLRVGVNLRSAGTLLAAVAVGGPVGFVLAITGGVMAYAGNKWLNGEVRRMESERSQGKTPVSPKSPLGRP